MGLVEIPSAIITRKTEKTTKGLKRILAVIALIVASFSSLVPSGQLHTLA